MDSSFLFSGVFILPWWGFVFAALGLTLITIVSVTVFLHRHQAHRAFELHPLASHFFRLWLWMTTGMVTKEWAAIHRKHHAKCETPEDPHSPQQVFRGRSEEHTSELQSPCNLVCRLLLEKKKNASNSYRLKSFRLSS